MDTLSIVSQIRDGLIPLTDLKYGVSYALLPAELVQKWWSDLPHFFLEMYNTYGSTLDSLHYVVLAEHLSGNGLFVAIACVKMCSWFSILAQIEDRWHPTVYVESLMNEGTPLVKIDSRLKWVHMRPGYESSVLSERGRYG